ncbi:MAG: hypothetical protein ABSE06_14045 [Anaerolineaceae bacterium]|jgi:hypothetical protein
MVETISLEKMLQTYRRLTAEYQAGRMTSEQYAAALKGLQAIDQAGHWWGVQPGGKFWMHDGRRWVPAVPPGLAGPAVSPGQAVRARPVQPQPAAPVVPAVHAGVQGAAPSPSQAAQAGAVGPIGQGIKVPQQAQAAANKVSALLKVSPVLAVVPSVVCGGLWFLYTFLGLFKSEGIVGVDWLTPLIIGAIPVLLWIFKKQVDRFLLPLRPMVISLAKPLRLGIVLAVPVLLGCMCATVTPAGYLSLNVSSMLSVVTATILMRY